MTAQSIFVALPAFGSVNTTATTMSLVHLAQRLAVEGIGAAYGTLTYPDIGELRNMFLSIWFDQIKSSHILFCDADMEWGPELVLDMLKFDQPLVGCIYPHKRHPMTFVGRPDTAEERRDGFLKVAGVGFGVTLVRRDCVEKMLEHDPSLADADCLKFHTAKDMLAKHGVTRLIRAFDSVQTDTGELSEDLSFCHRYRASGGEVWANIEHEIGHIGQYAWRGRYSDVLKAGEKK